MDQEKNPHHYSDPFAQFRGFTKAFGLDKTWAEHGLCRGYPGSKDENGWTWWMGDILQSVDRPGRGGSRPTSRERLEHEFALAALAVCSNCPVQYACTIWAVEAESTAGIWGVRSDNLRWLQKGMNRVVLEGASESGLPVEEYVTSVRLR